LTPEAPPLAAAKVGKPDPQPALTEKQLQAAVMKLAKLRGFEVFHPAVSQFSAAGWPDLVLSRPDRTLFRELKSAKGKLTAAQEGWLDRLRLSGLDADVWRPADLASGRIAHELAPGWAA
jgi:hypothetical protein